METYHIDHELRTVVAVDQAGEVVDLNVEGWRIDSDTELADFVRELAAEGEFDADVEAALLGELEGA